MPPRALAQGEERGYGREPPGDQALVRVIDSSASATNPVFMRFPRETVSDRVSNFVFGIIGSTSGIWGQVIAAVVPTGPPCASTYWHFAVRLSLRVTREGTMRSLSSNLVLAWLTLCLGLLSGCASTVQIVRAPFISPLVLPSSNNTNSGEFTLFVTVHNYDTVTSPDLWLGVYTEYWPNCTAAWCSQWPQTFPPPQVTGPPNTNAGCLHVGVLNPDAGWSPNNYTIDNGTLQCMQNSCPGHIWLTLTVDPQCRQRFPGPHTGIHLNWAESGALANEIISEF